MRSTVSFFFFNDTATTEIYTLSLHDALPICHREGGRVYENASSKCSASTTFWPTTFIVASSSVPMYFPLCGYFGDGDFIEVGNNCAPRQNDYRTFSRASAQFSFPDVASIHASPQACASSQ